MVIVLIIVLAVGIIVFAQKAKAPSILTPTIPDIPEPSVDELTKEITLERGFTPRYEVSDTFIQNRTGDRVVVVKVSPPQVEGAEYTIGYTLRWPYGGEKVVYGLTLDRWFTEI